jgi:hypothetical protein
VGVRQKSKLDIVTIEADALTDRLNQIEGLLARVSTEKETVQRRWYRATVGSAIVVACALLAYLFAAGIQIKSVHSLADSVEAYSLLVAVYFMPFAYGLVAWVILKDIPLYRLPIFNLHRQGMSAYREWRQQMTKDENYEFDYITAMVKRMAFHIAGVTVILSIIVFFS